MAKITKIRFGFISFEINLYLTAFLINCIKLVNSKLFFLIKKLDSAEIETNSDEPTNEIAPTLIPFLHSFTTQEPTHDEYASENKTERKELYEWNDINEINPINEIVEFHTLDDNENKLSTNASDLGEYYDTKQEPTSDRNLQIQNITESSISSSSSSTQTPGKYKLIGYVLSLLDNYRKSLLAATLECI